MRRLDHGLPVDMNLVIISIRLPHDSLRLVGNPPLIGLWRVARRGRKAYLLATQPTGVGARRRPKPRVRNASATIAKTLSKRGTTISSEFWSKPRSWHPDRATTWPWCMKEPCRRGTGIEPRWPSLARWLLSGGSGPRTEELRACRRIQGQGSLTAACERNITGLFSAQTARSRQ